MVKSRFVLSVLVSNHPGVLTRISSLISRRGYNIRSLTVGETENIDISRMTIELEGDDYVLDQVKKQLGKLIEVLQILELNPKQAVYRELLLVKVSSGEKTRVAIIEISNIFRAKVIDISTESLTIEITGDTPKTNAFLEMLMPYGIKEIARTGITALERGSAALNQQNKDKAV